MDSSSSIGVTPLILLIAFAFLLVVLAALLCIRIIRSPEAHLQKIGKHSDQDDSAKWDQLVVSTKRRGTIGLILTGVCFVVLILASFGLQHATQQLADSEKERLELLQSLRTKTAHVKKYQATSELGDGIALLEEVVKIGEETGEIDTEKLHEALEQLNGAIGKLDGVAEIYKEALKAQEAAQAQE